MKIGKSKSFLWVMLLSYNWISAQKIEPIPFGNFENWLTRDIQESYVLGGHTKRIYAIAPNGNVQGAIAYQPTSSPWTTSNVLAIVNGITKTSNTVFPEERQKGKHCARLESDLVTCYVLGIIKIRVMASGTIFLGETIEPITSTENPYEKLNVGIPFTQKPKALIYDFYATIANHNKITIAKGWSITENQGPDYAQVFILLQNRKELPDGSIVATRVGTGKEYITQTSNQWINEHKLPIYYGDIRNHPEYKKYMDLTSIYYAKNSKGKMVPVKEIEWGTKDTPVTHMIVFLSSGCYGAYVGALGNVLKVDNIKLEY